MNGPTLNIEEQKGSAKYAMNLPSALLPVHHTPPLAASRKVVGELVEAGIAANTRRAYEAALVQFDRALAGEPATDAVVAGYLAVLYENGKSPATCGQVVAAIKFRAKLQGVPAPVGPATSRVLAGIRRKGRERGRGQVQGVDFAHADAAAAVAASDGSLHGLRDAALIAVMSDGLLRVSELADLRVDDVAFGPDGDGRLTIRRSKTDQEGTGTVLFLGPPTAARVKRWMEAAHIQDGPLFRRVRRGGKSVGEAALSTVTVRNVIKRRCADSGLEGAVSGHSLRVGGAQSLAAAGASIAEMQTAGRWTSPQMPGHYARGQLAARGAVARIRYGR